MSLDGIWGIEILGLFGWETTGILVFENGRIIGGGNHHYSTGRYEMDGERIKLETRVTYHGSPRTLFGSADKILTIVADLQRVDGCLEGDAHRVDRPENTMHCKLTRHADLPS